MPVALLPRFAELCLAAGTRYERVALVTNARDKGSVNELFSALDDLWDKGLESYSLYGGRQADDN
jgi:UPF0042 nucleotide-binding protein